MNAIWRLTCGHTRARNLTSVSCAPFAAVIVATCRTIVADATNSCQWKVLAHSPIRRCWVFYRRRPVHWAMAVGSSSTSALLPWWCTNLTIWMTSLMSCPTYIRRLTIIRVEQLRMGSQQIKITITMIWSWITRWTSCPPWQASWPASLQSPKLRLNHPCLLEQNLSSMRSPSSYSSPTLPQLLWLLQLAWPTPPPLPPSPQSPELLHTAIAALEGGPAASTVGAPVPLVSPTVSPVRRPQACLPHSRTPTCCIIASTVTSTFLTTSSTPFTWAAMATRTHSSATSVVTSARASTTLRATLPAGSTSNGWMRKTFKEPLMDSFVLLIS